MWSSAAKELLAADDHELVQGARFEVGQFPDDISPFHGWRVLDDFGPIGWIKRDGQRAALQVPAHVSSRPGFDLDQVPAEERST